MRRVSFIVTVIAIIIVFLLFIWAAVGFNRLKPQYTFNVSSQTVIKQIRSLNRLETSTYTIEKVIDAGTNGNQLRQFLFGDRILLIAHGEAIAGFDLSKVKDSDIRVEKDTLRVNLPAPEILVTKLDNDQTRVYDRRQGLLTKGNSNLESAARQEAETVIRDAACKGGILNEAEKNGRNQLTALFKSLGFVTVVIDIPQGSC